MGRLVHANVAGQITSGAQAGPYSMRLGIADQGAGSDVVWDGNYAMEPFPWYLPDELTNQLVDYANLPRRSVGGVGDDYATVAAAKADPLLPDGVVLELDLAVIHDDFDVDSGFGTNNWTVIQPKNFDANFTVGERLLPVSQLGALARVRRTAGNNTIRIDHSARKVWFRGIRCMHNPGVGAIVSHFYTPAPTTEIATDIGFTQCLTEGAGPTGGGAGYECFGWQIWISRLVLTDCVGHGFNSTAAGTKALEYFGGRGSIIRRNFFQASTIVAGFGFASPSRYAFGVSHMIFEENHLYKANALWAGPKGGLEAKWLTFGLIQRNVIERGIWQSGQGDPTNCVPIGLKASGGGAGTPAMSGCFSVIARENWAIGYPKFMYVQPRGGGQRPWGVDYVNVHDNACVQMGEASDWWPNAGGLRTIMLGIQMFLDVPEPGHVSPRRAAVWRNLMVCDGDQAIYHAITANKNAVWGPAIAAKSKLTDTLFTLSDFGAHGGSGTKPFIQPPGEYEGWDLNFNVVPGRPRNDWPLTNYMPATLPFASTYNADYTLKASFLADLQAYHGVGNPIASGAPYRRSDGQVLDSTVPGPDLAYMVSDTGAEGANVKWAGSEIAYA